MTVQHEFLRGLLHGKPSGLSAENSQCAGRGAACGSDLYCGHSRNTDEHVLSSKPRFQETEHWEVALPIGEFWPLLPLDAHLHFWKPCFKGLAQKHDPELTIQLWTQTQLNKPCFTQLH